MRHHSVYCSMRRYLLILSTVVRCLVLEHGQKLLKSHSVHKMQKKNAWRPGHRPDPAGGAYSVPPDTLGRGLTALPKEPLCRSRPFGPRLSSPPNFRTPKLKSWLYGLGITYSVAIYEAESRKRRNTRRTQKHLIPN